LVIDGWSGETPLGRKTVKLCNSPYQDEQYSTSPEDKDVNPSHQDLTWFASNRL
jgi:hypothetical protein